MTATSMPLAQVAFSGASLHDPSDEALWEAAATATQSYVLVPQGDRHGCAVELVRYATRAPRPGPADHGLCDQGILNIAFGSRTVADYQAVVAQVSAGGYQVHDELAIGPAAARYLLDDQGFSVELLMIPDPGHGTGLRVRAPRMKHVRAAPVIRDIRRLT